MRSGQTLIAIAACAMLGGCATTPDPHPIAGIEWKLVSIDTTGSTTTLTPRLQQVHTLTFDDDGRASMQLDCNRGSAPWSADRPRYGGGSLAIGPVAATRALCPDPSFGEQMADQLPLAIAYRLNKDEGALVIETETQRLTFTSY